MNILKYPLCWFTRHHWLLQTERPTFQPHVFTYVYLCQVCGKTMFQNVTHLDNLTNTVGTEEEV